MTQEPSAKRDSVLIVGAGAGGLAAAIDLARRGVRVTVLDKNLEAGGKIRQVRFGNRGIDCGPTVFTMRWVFDALFADAGASLDSYLTLRPAPILARHAWRQGGRLDLFADVTESEAAIADFAGPKDAAGFRAFCARSKLVYETLRDAFIKGQRPSHLDVVRRVGLFRMPAFLRTIAPMTTLWSAVDRYFEDPRLKQLFGRYATYVGSSPFSTPSTIMLVAHVEQEGVWFPEGGMRSVASAMHSLAESLGAEIRFGAEVDRIDIEGGRASGVTLTNGEQLRADGVVFNGDIAALGQGLLGAGARSAGRATKRKARSLSAATWSMMARTAGFPLAFHNVFFAEDYRREFDAIFRDRTITETPTVYLCAPDRTGGAVPEGQERLFMLTNAPADGDIRPLTPMQREDLKDRILTFLAACGLQVEVDPGQNEFTTPEAFHSRFPATGGALYGQTSHGMMATLARAGAKTAVPGLFLAGGSVHPGPGVPMAAMSGRLAAACFIGD